MDTKRAAEVLQDISTATLGEITKAEDMSVQALLAWEWVERQESLPRPYGEGWEVIAYTDEDGLIRGEGPTPLAAVLDAMSKDGKEGKG